MWKLDPYFLEWHPILLYTRKDKLNMNKSSLFLKEILDLMGLEENAVEKPALRTWFELNSSLTYFTFQ